MSGAYTIYGDKKSGNCLKVLWTAQLLDVPFRWIEVDITRNETRTDEFLRLNPAGQVPTAILPDAHPSIDGSVKDKRALAQSNAIILHLAEGSDLIPSDPYARAKMLEWLFWEQYSHEPALAVRRFKKVYLNLPDEEIDPALMQKGRRALGVMELALLGRDFLAGDSLSLADISLVAYTRLAHEGGFDLTEFPQVLHWVGRVERALGLPPAKLPNHEAA